MAFEIPQNRLSGTLLCLSWTQWYLLELLKTILMEKTVGLVEVENINETI